MQCIRGYIYAIQIHDEGQLQNRLQYVVGTTNVWSNPQVFDLEPYDEAKEGSRAYVGNPKVIQ
jgi:hypothetical protein